MEYPDIQSRLWDLKEMYFQQRNCKYEGLEDCCNAAIQAITFADYPLGDNDC